MHLATKKYRMGLLNWQHPLLEGKITVLERLPPAYRPGAVPQASEAQPKAV